MGFEIRVSVVRCYGGGDCREYSSFIGCGGGGFIVNYKNPISHQIGFGWMEILLLLVNGMGCQYNLKMRL